MEIRIICVHVQSSELYQMQLLVFEVNGLPAEEARHITNGCNDAMRHTIGVIVIPLGEQRKKERPEPVGVLLGRLNNAAVIIPHERGVRDDSDFVRRVLFPHPPSWRAAAEVLPRLSSNSLL